MKTKVLTMVAAATLTLALNTAPAFSGDLNPSSAPAPTMRTMEQLKPSWDKIIPAAQRFVDALDGTAVLDKETGLVWAKSPDSTIRAWEIAMEYCAHLELGGRLGWRLPTIEELSTLVDNSNPGTLKLPVGHPFQNVLGTLYYWTSTTRPNNTGWAYSVNFAGGYVFSGATNASNWYVWPVRSGK